jgi:hypothetical protein
LGPDTLKPKLALPDLTPLSVREEEFPVSIQLDSPLWFSQNLHGSGRWDL